MTPTLRSVLRYLAPTVGVATVAGCAGILLCLLGENAAHRNDAAVGIGVVYFAVACVVYVGTAWALGPFFREAVRRAPSPVPNPDLVRLGRELRVSRAIRKDHDVADEDRDAAAAWVKRRLSTPVLPRPVIAAGWAYLALVQVLDFLHDRDALSRVSHGVAAATLIGIAVSDTVVHRRILAWELSYLADDESYLP